MEAKIKWIDQVKFKGESETGHKLLMDGPAESGGENQGMRPMELILLGIGGCTSYDVVTILKKSRQAVNGCEAHITAQRADSIPKVFTKIHIRFVIDGEGLDEGTVERAIKLSAEKYCSASIMLNKSVEITHDFTINKTKIT
ncbi:MAG: peroxiredoxin [Euryarchaeota archaeon]|nr:peroxiredoxin [Euryarchaeota archaeon]